MKLVVSKLEAQQMINTSSENMLRLLEKGEIPAYKTGRNCKIPVKCLEDYVIAKALEETRGRIEG